MKSIKSSKKGAASFYIVAFSTLILVIIATSFATVILSDITRSENDDLSQSAYDSALAGVEDAKVAFSNYRRCVEAGVVEEEQPMAGTTEITCGNIIWWMRHPDCYMVGHIIGKISKGEEEEVMVGGTEVSDGFKQTTTNQAYTCVKIDTDLSDYRASLTSDNMTQVIRAGVADGDTNTVNRIRISWYSVRADNKGFLEYSNFPKDESGNYLNKVGFAPVGVMPIAVPPTLEVQIVQTATKFKLSDFDRVESGKTNRGTVYLVPSDKKSYANAGGKAKAEDKTETESETELASVPTNYIGVWDDSAELNKITADQVVKTNDHSVSNKPFLVYCNPDSSNDFYCSAEIELPGVLGEGNRANDTFMIGLSLPYQRPDTDFSIELICDGEGEGGKICGGTKGETNSEKSESIVKIKNTQVSIDSTGRANDLYRRVETRLETSDTAFGYGSPYYALQVLNNEGGINKNLTVAREKNFYF